MTATATLAKNWKEIAALKNAYLKLCFVFTKDEDELLVGLSRAFPECFLVSTEGAQQKFPISLLLELAQAPVDAGDHDRSMTDEILEKSVGFPSMECIPDDSEFYQPAKHLPMPLELMERYNELHANFEQSGNFPWTLTTVRVLGNKYYVGYVSQEGAEPKGSHAWKCIWLYPVELVDLEA